MNTTQGFQAAKDDKPDLNPRNLKDYFTEQSKDGITSLGIQHIEAHFGASHDKMWSMLKKAGYKWRGGRGSKPPTNATVYFGRKAPVKPSGSYEPGKNYLVIDSPKWPYKKATIAARVAARFVEAAGPEHEKRLRKDMEGYARGAGKVLEVQVDSSNKWLIVFDTEYAALKVHYKFKDSPGIRLGKSSTPRGWYVSTR